MPVKAGQRSLRPHSIEAGAVFPATQRPPLRASRRRDSRTVGRLAAYAAASSLRLLALPHILSPAPPPEAEPLPGRSDRSASTWVRRARAPRRPFYALRLAPSGVSSGRRFLAGRTCTLPSRRLTQKPPAAFCVGRRFSASRRAQGACDERHRQAGGRGSEGCGWTRFKRDFIQGVQKGGPGC